MQVIVTGGAGFIGSAVVRHILRTTSFSVVNLDCLTYAGNLRSVSEVLPNSRYRHAQINICDGARVRELVQDVQPQAIIHLAAESHVDRSISGADTFIQTNILGTFTLLQACLDYWQRLGASAQDAFRFLHVSTDEVFGSLGAVGKFSEASPYQPNSPYSASKAAADHLVRAWHHTYGLPTLTTNCSNNYGPFHYPEKLIPLLIIRAINGQHLPVYGSGENIRDWLHVEDHAEALLLVLKKGRPGETYNVGANCERRNIDVVRTLCRILDDLIPNSAHRPHENLIEFVQDRPGHDARYAIDASKIERELGWRPKRNFEEGLEHTVRWFLGNEAWWKAAHTSN